MGYYTRYTGRITIDPPLTWSEIEGSRFLPDDTRCDLKFDLDVEITETDDGTLTRRFATAVVPLTDDSYKGYDIVEHLQEIVAAHPGHQFTGYISAEGEEAGDIWRLAVVNGRATQVKPQIVWPGEGQ